MKFLLKLTVLASLAVAIGLLACVQSGAGAPDPQSSTKLAGSARGRFTIPKLFDFENYKRLFHKSYASLAETLVRQKLFLSRAVRSLISMVNYKRGKLAYYLKLNKFSDRSKKELARMKNNQIGEQLLSRRVSSEAPNGRSKQGSSEKDTLVDPKNLNNVLEQLAEVYPNDQDIEGLRSKLGGKAEKVRRRRRVDSEKRDELSVDDLINADDSDKGTLAKTSDVPIYNNRDSSSASSKSRDIREQVTTMSMFILPSIESAREQCLVGDKPAELEDIEREIESSKAPPGNEDMVYFDHRESNCLSTPRDQGQCASCYAFALIAIAEWAHCKATGELVTFSEQYVVDCGHLVGLTGCDGGVPWLAVNFARNFGFELQEEYSYAGKVHSCPYEKSEDISSTGFVRMNADTLAIVPIDRWPKMIQQAPMYIIISMVGDFAEYGSGVWDSNECDNADHAVVLVGHGREDGQEYWLIRNSLSAGWGEGGYMKISKKSKCLSAPEAIVVGYNEGTLDARLEKNAKHNAETIKNRDLKPIVEETDWMKLFSLMG